MPFKSLFLLIVILAVGDAAAHTGFLSAGWIPAMGFPWFGASFLLGLQSKSLKFSAFSGFAVIAGATFLYYILSVIVAGEGFKENMIIAFGWIAAALPVGCFYGCAGFFAANNHRFLGWSLFGTALFGEAVALILVWPSNSYFYLFLELVIAVIVIGYAFTQRRSFTEWYSSVQFRVIFLLSCTSSTIFAVTSLRYVLRFVGWNGM